MITKVADNRRPDIETLERLARRSDATPAIRQHIEAEVRAIRAGEAGEREAAYVIDLHFGRSPNWAVIHDLRIEVGGYAAQIDHVLINRLAQLFVCESKHFADGVSVNEHGEWSRWFRGRSEGMPSPIEQNRRHILLLDRAFEDGLIQAPKRLGLVRRRPEMRSVVLVSDNAKISRPKRPIDGLETVIKAERLKAHLFDAYDEAGTVSAFGMIGKEGLETFARELAALHRPATWDWPARFGLAAVEPASAAVPPTTATAPPAKPWLVKYDGPCSTCGKVLAKGTPAVWDRQKRRMFCLDCAA